MNDSRRDHVSSDRVSYSTLSRPPKVSVGLAVYNGERYLHDAISSIVTQTFRDFELIICDNDSTDGTREICLGFAAKDERIRYLRNPVNIGGVRNENRTMFLARGEYFKLAAHDDLIAPEFLRAVRRRMDSNENCDVCVTGAVIIGERRRADRDAHLASRERVASVPADPFDRRLALLVRGLVPA